MIYIKLQNCCFFFFEVYFEGGTPEMYTNQLKDVYNRVHFFDKIDVISSIKYTTIYSKTWPSSLLYIQQRRIQNPFKRQTQSFGGVL